MTVPDESPNGTDPADGLTPFERFKRLTKALVAVPKADVDEERRKAAEASESARVPTRR